MAKNNLIYDVEDKPSWGKTIVFALQQLLAIMAATIAVPMIIGHGMQPSPVFGVFGAVPVDHRAVVQLLKLGSKLCLFRQFA